MATLEKRIEVLEQASPSNIMGPIFIHLVGLDTKDKEMERITRGDIEWHRLPGESVDELKERAKRESVPIPQGVITYLCF